MNMHTKQKGAMHDILDSNYSYTPGMMAGLCITIECSLYCRVMH